MFEEAEMYKKEWINIEKIPQKKTSLVGLEVVRLFLVAASPVFCFVLLAGSFYLFVVWLFHPFLVCRMFCVGVAVFVFFLVLMAFYFCGVVF